MNKKFISQFILCNRLYFTIWKKSSYRNLYSVTDYISRYEKKVHIAIYTGPWLVTHQPHHLSLPLPLPHHPSGDTVLGPASVPPLVPLPEGKRLKMTVTRSGFDTTTGNQHQTSCLKNVLKELTSFSWAFSNCTSSCWTSRTAWRSTCSWPPGSWSTPWRPSPTTPWLPHWSVMLAQTSTPVSWLRWPTFS